MPRRRQESRAAAATRETPTHPPWHSLAEWCLQSVRESSSSRSPPRSSAVRCARGSVGLRPETAAACRQQFCEEHTHNSATTARAALTSRVIMTRSSAVMATVSSYGADNSLGTKQCIAERKVPTAPSGSGTASLGSNSRRQMTSRRRGNGVMRCPSARYEAAIGRRGRLTTGFVQAHFAHLFMTRATGDRAVETCTQPQRKRVR
jgi:hypothetical protein